MLFLDGRKGRSQGRRGIPDVSLQVPFSSAWLNQRIQIWNTYASALELHTEERIAEYVQWLVAAPPILSAARAELNRAEEAVLAHRKTGLYTQRRLGETGLTNEFVSIRRRREFERELKILQDVRDECARELSELEQRLLTSQEVVDEARAQAARELSRAWHITQRRWERFAEGVLRKHPYPERLRQLLPSLDTAPRTYGPTGGTSHA